MLDKLKFTVYMDAAGQWRWRARTKNYRIVADGSEGYVQRHGALMAVHRLVGYFGFEPEEVKITVERLPPAPVPGQ